MSIRTWVGIAVLAGATWMGLSALDDPAPPPATLPTLSTTSSSKAALMPPAQGSSTTPVPAAKVGKGEIEGSGGAVTAAVAYVEALTGIKGHAARLTTVTSRVLPQARGEAPLLDADPAVRVAGPGQILVIDGSAAVVQVPTDTGLVFLEMRRVRDRWFVAGAPSGH